MDLIINKPRFIEWQAETLIKQDEVISGLRLENQKLRLELDGEIRERKILEEMLEEKKATNIIKLNSGKIK